MILALLLPLGFGVASAQDPIPPARARYHYLLAEWRLAHGDAAGAVESARVALLHDRHAAAPRVLMARLALADGRSEDALRFANEAVAEAPRVASAWIALAELREAVGDRAGARAARDRAGELEAP